MTPASMRKRPMFSIKSDDRHWFCGQRSTVNRLKQSRLLAIFGIGEAQMRIRQTRGGPALRGTVDKAKLQEIRLNHIHDRVSFFADRGSDGVQPDRAAAKLLNNGLQHAAVDIVEAKRRARPYDRVAKYRTRGEYLADAARLAALGGPNATL